MTWLAVVFIWFGATVLRGFRQHFAWGALWSAFFVLGATHVLNPDAFIVRTNIALMREGRNFDAGYNASLSHDAVPELIGILNELNHRDQCAMRTVLWGRLSSRNEQDDTGIRSWNLSRTAARPFLIENSTIHGEISYRTRCSEVFSDGLGDKAAE